MIYPKEIMPKKKKKTPLSEADKKRIKREEQAKSVAANLDLPCTRAAYAAYCGVTPQTISEWIKRHAYPLTPDNKIIPRQFDELRAISDKATQPDSEESTTASRLAELKLKKAEQDLRIATLKADELDEKLVHRDKVSAYYFEVVTEARTALQNLHKKVCPRMFIPKDRYHEATEVLRTEIDNILETLASKLQ